MTGELHPAGYCCAAGAAASPDPCPWHVDGGTDAALAELPDPVDPQQVVVRWDDDTRDLIAALYGEAHLERVEAAATDYVRAQLEQARAAQTSGPGAPPVAPPGEEARRSDAGGPGRDPLEAAP